MKVHEYQAKEILAARGIPVPEGLVARTVDELREAAARLFDRGHQLLVVKAQVHVGGRGKAGGVKLARSVQEAVTLGSRILGMDIKGLTVKTVLVEQGIDIREEYYAGFIVDRDTKRVVLMLSKEGGVDIEEVAERNPEAIVKHPVDPLIGLAPFVARQLAIRAGLNRRALQGIGGVVSRLYDAFVGADASLAEINPLVITGEGRVVAADAKIDLDDGALYRHPEFRAYHEPEEEHPLELEAQQYGFAYVKLDGDVGVIGNGAGLVMASLDAVAREGGRPANFLDIGGGAKAETVEKALGLVLRDPDVKGVLFNIFGGITRGDEVARGVLQVAARMTIDKPVVIRLSGTAADEGRKLLEGSDLIAASTMNEAARKVVEVTS
jgi:succinyl-CoA synthetase beta subunit